MLKEMEQEIVNIKNNLKASQDRKKSYAYFKMVQKEFKVGDHVYLGVKPRKSSLMLGSCAKLEARYFRKLKILEKIGIVSYRIALPTNMRAHNVFHVSSFKKYLHDPNHIIDWNVTQVEPKGAFQVEPMHILDEKVALLSNQAIKQVKVQWKCLGLDEYTWELEDAMKEAYPFLFKF